MLQQMTIFQNAKTGKIAKMKFNIKVLVATAISKPKFLKCYDTASDLTQLLRKKVWF